MVFVFVPFKWALPHACQRWFLISFVLGEHSPPPSIVSFHLRTFFAGLFTYWSLSLFLLSEHNLLLDIVSFCFCSFQVNIHPLPLPLLVFVFIPLSSAYLLVCFRLCSFQVNIISYLPSLIFMSHSCSFSHCFVV